MGVALSDLGGRFTDVNRALRALLDGTGIDPDADGPLALARYLPPGSDEADAWSRGLADVCAGRTPVVRAELPVTVDDGPPRWLQATAALIVLGDHRYLLTHVEDTTGRRLVEQRLARLALHDDLTGLANRTLLRDRLGAALARDVRTGLHTGVLYIDLDHFKRINDTLGHDVGDRVLVAVAHRLATTLRAGDTAGRVGGDEFLVIAGDVPDEAALGDLARRLAAALALPLETGSARPGPARTGGPRSEGRESVGPRLPMLSASVGAALALPGDTLSAAMARADAAMFTAKRTRRATARVDVDALQLTLMPDPAADPRGVES